MSDIKFKDWLNTAIPFSVWRIKDKEHIKACMKEISNIIGESDYPSRTRSRDKAMLTLILMNLWLAFLLGVPIRIYLNKKYYNRKEAYGKVHFGYRRTMRLLSGLKDNGFMDIAKGYNTPMDSKTSRIWATNKLIELFIAHKWKPVGDVEPVSPDILQLREKVITKEKTYKSQKEVIYDDTEQTLKMKENLTQYNTFTEQHKITLKISGENEITANFLISYLLNGVISGAAKIINAELDLLAPEKHPLFNDTEFIKTKDILTVEDLTELILRTNNYYNSISSNSDSSNANNSNSADTTSSCSSISGSADTVSADNNFNTNPDSAESMRTNSSSATGINSNSIKEASIYSNKLNNGYGIYKVSNDIVNPYISSCITNPIENLLYNYQWSDWLDMDAETAMYCYLSLLKNGIPSEQLKEKVKLTVFGIKSLDIEIRSNRLHRVFNEGDLAFSKGGRFYGGWYQTLSPKELRESIFINGNPTAEIDFSGHHIRMLYHQSGLKYENDPYDFAWEEEKKDYLHLSGAELEMKKKEVRSKYKAVGLISINAEKKGAAGAIKEKLEQEKIYYGSGKGCIKELMSKMKNNHEPIKDFLFSGVGLDLQNSDSRIMEQILMALYEKGILALCIHDSIIVEAQYSELANSVMVEAYKAFFDGFEPVLKVKSAA